MYIRMMFLMFVTLYTSRIMLEALGIVDFGINNVVGGIITMLSFINGSMSLAVNRFLSFEMGLENKLNLNKIFSVSINIHLVIAFLGILLGETIGLWFINTQLVIPDDRLFAANWIYQFSIFSFVFTVLRVPYNAAIIAHEDMKIYAYVGIFEGLFRLLIAFALLYFAVDKLILYGALLAFATMMVTGFYYLKCKRTYNECTYHYIWDKKMFKEMFAFAGISTMGNLSTVVTNQGQNILLNMFFGPVVNAARAISYQLNGAFSQFVTNIYTAVTPQITKSYASKDRLYLVKIVDQSSLFALLCLLAFVLPAMLELPFILSIWLGKNVPENTALFSRLVLVDLLLLNLCRPLIIAIQSSGKIFKIHLYTGTLELLNIPIAFCFLHFAHSEAYMVFIIKIVMDLFLVAVVLYISRIQLNWDITQFIKLVLVRSIVVASVVILSLLFVQYHFTEGFFRLSLICISSVILIMSLCYFYILDSSGRQQVKKIVTNRFFRLNRK